MQRLLTDVITQATSHSQIDACEVYMTEFTNVTYSFKEKTLFETKSSEQRGLQLRVLGGEKIGSATTTQFDQEAIGDVIERAVQNMLLQSPKQGQDFATPMDYPEVLSSEADLLDRSLEEKWRLATTLSDQVGAIFDDVYKIERTTYGEGMMKAWLYNSRGVQYQDQQHYASIGGVCLARNKDGQEESGSSGQSIARWSDFDVSYVAQEMGFDATKLLGACSIPSFIGEILLPPEHGSLFLNFLVGALSYESVFKKVSLFPHEGEKIASPLLSIKDDPWLSYALGTTACDGEGLPTKPFSLVEEGVLKTHLYDIRFANKIGRTPTASSLRGTYAGGPSVGVHNIVVKAGDTPLAELYRNMQRGVVVTDILGAHTVNPITGEFSFGMSGLYVEHGQVKHPFRGATLAGNLKDVYRNIVMVSAERERFSNALIPSLLVENMSIGGV